jgi:hypothetical protein
MAGTITGETKREGQRKAKKRGGTYKFVLLLLTSILMQFFSFFDENFAFTSTKKYIFILKIFF